MCNFGAVPLFWDTSLITSDSWVAKYISVFQSAKFFFFSIYFHFAIFYGFVWELWIWFRRWFLICLRPTLQTLKNYCSSSLSDPINGGVIIWNLWEKKLFCKQKLNYQRNQIIHQILVSSMLITYSNPTGELHGSLHAMLSIFASKIKVKYSIFNPWSLKLRSPHIFEKNLQSLMKLFYSMTDRWVIFFQWNLVHLKEIFWQYIWSRHL